MEEKPNYYAVIPSEVRYDTNLRANEKLLYGEITALTYKTGECWASNNYFSQLYSTTPQAISKWILNLKKNGYIDIDYEYNGKEIKKRVIKVSTYIDRYQQNINRGINICLGGYQQKVKENNTSINNTSINKYIDDNETNDLFLDFLEMRKKKKIPNTDRAIKLLINKLDKLSIEEQKKALEESIVKGWTSVYPKESKMPEWADKEQVKEEINGSEKKELEEMLKEFE